MSRRREIVRLAEAAGWRVELTRGGHLRFSHADADGPVFAAATPGDRRDLRNVRASLRRPLRPARNPLSSAPGPSAAASAAPGEAARHVQRRRSTGAPQ